MIMAEESECDFLVFPVWFFPAPGSRPLHWAAHEGSVGAMALLLAHGADPNLPDSSGMPPLLRAAQRGDCASLKLLHAHGADLHARSGLFGRSALALAAERGHPEACEVLLGLGANATAKDMGGRTPLEMATGGAVEVLRAHAEVLRREQQQQAREG